MKSIMKSPLLSAADQKYDVDIAIVGSGLSGLSAALTAAESGLKAIVLEKLSDLGGTGIFPEGSLGIGTRYQKEKGIRTTTDQVFAKVMEFHHWRCNAAVIRTLLNESGKTIDWLMDHGIKIKSIRTMFPPEKSLQVWHILEGGGARVVKVMSDHFKKKRHDLTKYRERITDQ
jgi:fumarate reductase flavoprotein subunit